MAIDKLQGVPAHWREHLIDKRRAYFTSKDAASRFKDTCCHNYVMAAPISSDWYGAWVVFYY